jgi:oxalate decarboxylase/phosphoglucose isomerase-like protein (cupin superfamily)
MERPPNLTPVSADVQDAPGKGLGGTIKVIATPHETGVRVAVVEEVTPPHQGPPMHMHTHEDEIFYVVEGRMRFWRGKEAIRRTLMARRVVPLRQEDNAVRVEPLVFQHIDATDGFFLLHVDNRD